MQLTPATRAIAATAQSREEAPSALATHRTFAAVAGTWIARDSS